MTQKKAQVKQYQKRPKTYKLRPLTKSPYMIIGAFLSERTNAN